MDQWKQGLVEANCFKNGILPITLDSAIVEKLQHETGQIEVDLENQVIKTSSENKEKEEKGREKKVK